jgi:hypothetical protein
MKRIIILTIAFFVSFQITTGQVSTEHLNTYLWEYPLQQGLAPDPQLMGELVAEMEKIIESGDLFFRPLPNDFADQFDDSYFLYREPGRILQTIALAYPYLEPTMQATLRTMVQQLFANTVHQPWAIVPGQPWEHYLLPVDAGKQRKSFTPANIWGDPNHGRYRPTIQNTYNVWLYAYRTGDAISVQPYYNAIRTFYDNKIGGNDLGRFYGTMNAHIGMARLAQMFNDEDQVAAATTNLTNALNFGLDITDVDDLARNGTAGWNGAYAFAYDDRAIDWVNRNYIFHNISPEIGRYLNDYLQSQTEARHDYMMNRFPMWWLREAPYFNRWTGDEGIGTPSSSFGTNVPLERWFRNVDSETLASYMISSPVGVADSYWIEALVVAMESNAADVWVDVRTTPFQTDIQQDFVWSGNVSNDWHNPANWLNNEVPGAADNVIIPATAGNFPTLLATGTCNNILLGSSATGTASLIDNGFLTVNGTATVQRHIDAANWDDGNDGWHFVSAPVASQAIADDWTPAGEGNDYDFYAWSDNNSPLSWLNQKVPSNNLTHFIPGKGYLVAYQTGGVRAFKGGLNTGNVEVTLLRSPDSYWSGWNLLGNPYSSSIDWNLADRSLFEDDFAYVYNTSRAGGAGYELIDGSMAGSLIAPHQGFFARAGETANGLNFSFTNEIRAHGGIWLKNNFPDDHLRLRLTNEDFFEETILRIRDGSHFERDRQDALKLLSFNPNVPQFYSITSNNVKVAVNSIPSIPDEIFIALGMLMPDHGNYTISITDIQGKFAEIDILLEDVVSGITQNLSENKVYRFNIEAGESNSRFLLKFGTDNSPEFSAVHYVYSYGKTLFVLNQKEEALVEVFNAFGQVVLSKTIEVGLTTIQTTLPAGAYFVRMTSNDETSSAKVVLF